MVDASAMGRMGTPFEIELERGKVREFARATFSANPAYLREPHPVIPPTFLTTMAFWAEDAADPWPSVAMDPRRGLHAEQEYVFHGPPPRAGTTLTAQSRIADIVTKPGRRGGQLTFVVMVTEFYDSAGRLVAEARLTGVETGGLDDAEAATRERDA